MRLKRKNHAAVLTAALLPREENNMSTDQELKELVKEKYGEIALQSKEQNETSCCGSTCGCNTSDYAIMAEDYTKLSGYVADADLGLGCGLPTEFAQIKPGNTVVDLGSGAGNDAFVARSLGRRTRRNPPHRRPPRHGAGADRGPRDGICPGAR